MGTKLTKITCLVLLFALLTGLVACRLPLAPSSPGTTGLTQILPSSSSTAPTTEPLPTEPQATPPLATEPEPTEPEPEPLPPGTGAAQQAPITQQPILAGVTIPSLNAANCFIFDTASSEFLYISCRENKAIYPASTTKLFTAYVALQHLASGDIITVGNELSYVAWDASTAGFKKGDKVSVETLVYAALLPSGCDASYILAAAAGRVILGDSSATAKAAIAAFMDECNRLAKELGMKNTNLVTPDGYHAADHKISMQAFAIIGKLCLKNKLIATVTSTTETTVTYTRGGETRSMDLKNTNQTIQPDSEYYNSLAVGLKTGFTDEAGHCLLAAYQVDGRYILVGVFGSTSANKRFQDANKLLNAFLPYL